MESPVASMMTYAISLPLDIPFLRKVRYAINYYRFGIYIHKEKLKMIFAKYDIDMIPFYWYWTKPIGKIMHIIDTKLQARS